MTAGSAERVPLLTIAKEWGRIGSIGFGGPPTHIALLRKLCVDERGWLPPREFEDGIAATSLLPGPSSTQLAIFCAWRLRGWRGGILGGVFFIAPGLIVILALSAVFLAAHPPLWVLAAAAGAGAAVPAVAAQAAMGLMPASWRRMGSLAGTPAGTQGGTCLSTTGGTDATGSIGARARSLARTRWIVYVMIGIIAGVLAGAYLVLVLVACGLVEIALTTDWRARGAGDNTFAIALFPLLALAGAARGGGAGAAVRAAGGRAAGGLAAVGGLGAIGGLGAVAWVAVKVGMLSYGGGFVIVPLMQHDAVSTYHWMTGAQFLNAVALGQITPGPVVQTVAVVGYAAAGLGGGLLAATIAFTPSFLFVILGGRYFDRLRANPTIQKFLTGAGATVIGAIAGSALPLGLALTHLWQAGILAAALIWLLLFRRGVVTALIGAGLIGVLAVLLLGAPVTH